MNKMKHTKTTLPITNDLFEALFEYLEESRSKRTSKIKQKKLLYTPKAGKIFYTFHLFTQGFSPLWKDYDKRELQSNKLKNERTYQHVIKNRKGYTKQYKWRV